MHLPNVVYKMVNICLGLNDDNVMVYSANKVI